MIGHGTFSNIRRADGLKQASSEGGGDSPRYTGWSGAECSIYFDRLYPDLMRKGLLRVIGDWHAGGHFRK
jgi:hypothetical protein